jgi:hypothetical protein
MEASLFFFTLDIDAKLNVEGGRNQSRFAGSIVTPCPPANQNGPL